MILLSREHLQRRRRYRRRLDTHLGLLFILPTLIVLAVTIIYPLLSIVVYSVQSLDIGGSGTFIGLANYQAIMQSSDFTGGLVKSLTVTILSVALTLALGMGVALLLNAEFQGRGLARSLVVLPWAMPTFAAAFAWRWMLDYNYGAINHLLVASHVATTPIPFLSETNLSLVVASLVYTWKGLPWAILVLLAGLQVVPQDLREAARVDGASAVREWLHVVLPSTRFVIQITVVLLFIWNFNWFDMMWLLTQGGPGNATAVLPIIIYRQAFQAFNLGYGAALSVIVLAILLLVTFVMFRLWSKEESAL